MPDYSDKEQDVEVIKADYLLQAKVGTGKIPAKLIKKGQNEIDKNDFDFVPLAQEFLKELAVNLEESRKLADKIRLKNEITNSVMQLKANASTFHYDLVGTLAGNMLDFIEEIKEIDEDVIEITNAHYRTISALIAKRMAGTGGPFGKELEQELGNACQRYFTKHGREAVRSSAA